MAKSQELFDLIKTLSKAEKRHFKMTAGKTRQPAQYVRLFDAFEAQQQYDETRLQQAMQKHVSGNQLHVLKQQLQFALLKSLRLYHEKASVDGEIKNILRDVEILFRKDLPRLCSQRLQKAEHLAVEHEKQIALLDILAWKRKLLLANHSSYQVVSALAKIAKQEQQCIEKIQVVSRYWRLSADIFQFNSSNSDQFKHNAYIRSAERAQTVQAKTLRYHVLFADAFIAGDLKQADQTIAGLIHLLEQHPAMIRDDPGAYITAVNNRVGLKLAAKQPKAIPPLLNKIRTVADTYHIKRTHPIISRHLLRAYNVELEMYRDTRQIKPGIALIEEIISVLNKQDKKVSADFKVLFYYQFAYLYYLDGDFNRSLFWLNAMIKNKFGRVREDIQSYARLLTLIIHYELGHITVLKYAVESCRRFLKSKQKLRRFENTLLNFFSRISLAPSGRYDRLIKEVYENLFLTPDAGVTDDVLDYLNFRSWLESKMKPSASVD